MEINHEYLIRFGLFASVLIIMMLWESLAPRRNPVDFMWVRRINNILLVACSTFMVWIFIPVSAVWISMYAKSQDWGLFNIIDMPLAFEILISILLLDLLIYSQHVAFHKIPLLWRLHRVHHTDQDFDTTTGIRFHPLEFILSMGIKMAGILVIGAPMVAVIIFEILLNSSSLFNHGNVGIPAKTDKILRWFIVTPDMHRVHHSVIREETDSNYGFNLSWWDKLFGTYRAQPVSGHIQMKIGLNEFTGARAVKLLWLLVLPFIKQDRFRISIKSF